MSGISLVLNRNNSPSFEKDANGALVDITGERRISDVKIADEPIQPDNAYTLAVSLSAYDHISTIYKVLSEAEENDETNRSALIKYISDNRDKVPEWGRNGYNDIKENYMYKNYKAALSEVLDKEYGVKL